jgi:hypothetical protein
LRASASLGTLLLRAMGQPRDGELFTVSAALDELRLERGNLLVTISLGLGKSKDP